MKTKILFIALFAAIFSFSQEQVKFIKRGTLTLINNEKIEFSNLVYEKDKVTYTNLNNQAKEHLYLSSILSIDSGEVEMVDADKVVKIKKGITLDDGAYYSLDNLVKKQSKSGEFTLVDKNINKDLYYFKDASGKKVNDALAIVKDGELYIRGGGVKKNLTKKSGLSFRGNRKIFVKMSNQNDVYVGRAPFANSAVSIPGAIVSGVAGGILAPGIGSAIAIAVGGTTIFSLASNTKKDIVVDLNKQEFYLR